MKDKLLCSVVGSNGVDEGHSPIERLTDREIEVFGLLGEGNGTREIAEKLCLSVKTVETYRARLKEKLSLSSGSKLLQQAFEWVHQRDKSSSM